MTQDSKGAGSEDHTDSSEEGLLWVIPKLGPRPPQYTFGIASPSRCGLDRPRLLYVDSHFVHCDIRFEVRKS